jgi:Homeodomain-containing transcription factor
MRQAMSELDGRAGLGCSKARRPRWTPSEDAKVLLETIFSADSFPTLAVRNQLASQLGIDPRQVQIWFQNRRQRERLKRGGKEADEGADAEAGGAKPGRGGSLVCWPPAAIEVRPLPDGQRLVPEPGQLPPLVPRPAGPFLPVAARACCSH